MSAIYDNYKKIVQTAGVNLTTDTIKVALLTSSYTPNLATDTYWGDINANESSGTGYTARGQNLTSPTVTVDGSGRGVFGAANTSWASSTIANARYAAIYKDTGTNSTSALIAVIDFGSAQSTNGDTFTIQWNASGIFYLA